MISKKAYTIHPGFWQVSFDEYGISSCDLIPEGMLLDEHWIFTAHQAMVTGTNWETLTVTAITPDAIVNTQSVKREQEDSHQQHVDAHQQLVASQKITIGPITCDSDPALKEGSWHWMMADNIIWDTSGSIQKRHGFHCPEEPKKNCDCGAASVGSPGHSHWCSIEQKR